SRTRSTAGRSRRSPPGRPRPAAWWPATPRGTGPPPPDHVQRYRASPKPMRGADGPSGHLRHRFAGGREAGTWWGRWERPTRHRWVGRASWARPGGRPSRPPHLWLPWEGIEARSSFGSATVRPTCSTTGGGAMPVKDYDRL